MSDLIHYNCLLKAHMKTEEIEPEVALEYVEHIKDAKAAREKISKKQGMSPVLALRMY